MTTSFGRDISCTDSLRTGRFVSGLRLVAEAAWRRLNTPRGMLRGNEKERDYGKDLSEYIGHPNPKQAAAELPQVIRNELKKDERIEDVSTTVTRTKLTGGAEALDIAVECSTAEGPFTLSVRITDEAVDLLGIQINGGG